MHNTAQTFHRISAAPPAPLEKPLFAWITQAVESAGYVGILLLMLAENLFPPIPTAARHGRWLTLHPDEIDRASAWFLRRGWAAVLVGRLVPGVRTLISVPAGIAGMPLLPFLVTSAIGTLLWTGVLAGFGFILAERYGAVSGWIEPVANGVVILALAGYVYRVIRFRH